MSTSDAPWYVRWRNIAHAGGIVAGAVGAWTFVTFTRWWTILPALVAAGTLIVELQADAHIQRREDSVIGRAQGVLAEHARDCLSAEVARKLTPIVPALPTGLTAGDLAWSCSVVELASERTVLDAIQRPDLRLRTEAVSRRLDGPPTVGRLPATALLPAHTVVRGRSRLGTLDGEEIGCDIDLLIPSHAITEDLGRLMHSALRQASAEPTFRTALVRLRQLT